MSTSIDKTIAGARGALPDALARGGRVLADLRGRYDDRLAEDRLAKEVLGARTSLERCLAVTSDPTSGDAELGIAVDRMRELAPNLARDLPTLRALAAARPQTPVRIMARIGQSWAGGLGAGVVDGLFGSQIPSILGGFGFFLGWLYTDGDASALCLEVSRGMGAATFYSAAKALAASARRGPGEAAQ